MRKTIEMTTKNTYGKKQETKSTNTKQIKTQKKNLFKKWKAYKRNRKKLQVHNIVMHSTGIQHIKAPSSKKHATTAK